MHPGDGAIGRLSSYMPRTTVSVAYPGLRLRPDVYATHGHYLDLPLTVPRIESVIASGMARVTGRGRDLRSAAEYEAALGPMYAFFGGLAEAMSGPTLKRSGSLSRNVWQRANGRSRAGLAAAHARRHPRRRGRAQPARRGPARARHLRRGPAPRRARRHAQGGRGARARRRPRDLRPHPPARDRCPATTRPNGPPPRARASGTAAAGATSRRSWDRPAHPGPYWPGTLVRLDDAGPPRIENVLEGVTLPAPAV